MLYIFDMGGVVTTTAAVEGKIAAILGISEADFLRFCGATGDNVRTGSPSGADSNHIDGNLLTMYSDGSISAKEFWQIFSERSSLAVKTDWWRCLFHPVRNEAVWHLIQELRERGNRVVCGTNTIESHYLNHLERGDYAVFDQTYASCALGVSKPHPEFWKIILAAEEVAATDAFFVDDKRINCDAAALLGMRTFHFCPPADKNPSEYVQQLRGRVGLDAQ